MPADSKTTTSFVRRVSGFSETTPVQTKKSKLGVAGGPRKVDFVFLMEKYGTRKIQPQNMDDSGEDLEEPPEDPGMLMILL